MRLGRALCLCTLWLSAVGCRTVSLYADPTAHGEPQVPPLDAFDIEWTTTLAPLALMEYAPREVAAPALDEGTGRVVALTRDGIAHGLSAEGKELWRFPTGLSFNAGATVKDGVAYVPGANGVLYALDVRTDEKTGKVLWRYDAKEELATSPVLSGERLYVASETDTLFALNAKTGKWLWQHRRDQPSGFTVRGTATPVEKDGLVWMGYSDGTLVALNPSDGTASLEKPLSSGGTQFLDVDTTAQFDDSGRVFAASYQDGVFALDTKTGDIQWHTSGPGFTSLLLIKQVLFAAGDRRVAAFETRTGKLLWTLNVGERFARQPVLAKGMLLVPTDNALRFVEPRIGRARLLWNPGAGISATPTFQGGYMYALSNLGRLYKMRLLP